MIGKTSCWTVAGLLAAGVLSAFAGETQKAKMGEPLAVAEASEGGGQYWPRAAWAAETKTWLVVWEDGWLNSERSGQAQDIYAARVAADGKVLDSKGIAVCKAKDFQQRPRVASDGKGFLVVWQDIRNAKDYDIYAARVAADGKVLDPDGFLVSGGAPPSPEEKEGLRRAGHNQCFPDVAFGPSTGSRLREDATAGTAGQSGGQYYIVWRDCRRFPAYGIYGARVSPEGKVLDANGIVLEPGMPDAQIAKRQEKQTQMRWLGFDNQGGSDTQVGLPAVGWDGQSWYACYQWMQPGNLKPHFRCARIDGQSGQPVGSPIKSPSYPWEFDAPRPAVSGKPGGGFFMGLYNRYHGWGTASIMGFRLWDVPDMAKPPKEFLPVYVNDGYSIDTESRAGVCTMAPDVARSNERYLFVWDRYSEQLGPGVGKSRPPAEIGMRIVGFLLDKDGRRLLDAAAEKTAEPDTWEGDQGGSSKLKQPPKLEPLEISGADDKGKYAMMPAVSGGADKFLVVWSEERGPEDVKIMARIVEAK